MLLPKSIVIACRVKVNAYILMPVAVLIGDNIEMG